jgi:hypothetical protein
MNPLALNVRNLATACCENVKRSSLWSSYIICNVQDIRKGYSTSLPCTVISLTGLQTLQNLGRKKGSRKVMLVPLQWCYQQLKQFYFGGTFSWVQMRMLLPYTLPNPATPRLVVAGVLAHAFDDKSWYFDSYETTSRRPMTSDLEYQTC